MQADELGNHIEQVERRGDGQELNGNPARRSEGQSNCRSQINSQTARANPDRRSEDKERALRPLMADQGEAALQSEGDRQETVGQEVWNSESCDRESEGDDCPTVTLALKIRSDFHRKRLRMTRASSRRTKSRSLRSD